MLTNVSQIARNKGMQNAEKRNRNSINLKIAAKRAAWTDKHASTIAGFRFAQFAKLEQTVAYKHAPDIHAAELNCSATLWINSALHTITSAEKQRKQNSLFLLSHTDLLILHKYMRKHSFFNIMLLTCAKSTHSKKHIPLLFRCNFSLTTRSRLARKKWLRVKQFYFAQQ